MQTHLVSTKRPSDLVDDVLVQRAHVGDQGAFEILVDRAFLSVSAHLPPFPMSALHEDSTVCEEMKLPSLFLEKESQYARSTDHEYRLGYLDNRPSRKLWKVLSFLSSVRLLGKACNVR